MCLNISMNTPQVLQEYPQVLQEHPPPPPPPGAYNEGGNILLCEGDRVATWGGQGSYMGGTG